MYDVFHIVTTLFGSIYI